MSIFKECHHCTDDRHPGCHATCERYKRAKEKSDQIKAAANADKDARIYEYQGMMKRHNKKAMARKKHVTIRRNYR